jgi:hypothetical protein
MDIVERLRCNPDMRDDCDSVSMDEAADEIESLLQQLAECQAREKAALRILQTSSYHPEKDRLFELFENLDAASECCASDILR